MYLDLDASNASDVGALGADGLAGVGEAVAAIARGEMAVVVDSSVLGGADAPASLVMAAGKVTPEAVNFMAIRGRGLISVALPRERLEQLEIDPMAARPTNPRHAGFHVAVDHRTTTTGISAADRAATIAALADPDTLPGDLARPGHVLPVACDADDLPGTSGLPAFAVDLARRAGLAPAAILCEVLAEDGEPASLSELRELGRDERLPVLALAL